jgi:hypothetical protein
MSWFIIFLIIFITLIFLVIFIYNKLVEIREKYYNDLEKMKNNLKERVNVLLELMENTAIYADFDNNDMKALIDFKTQISAANDFEELKKINDALKKIHYDIWFILQKTLGKKLNELENVNHLNVRIENLENKFNSIIFDIKGLEKRYKKLLDNPIFSFLNKASIKDDNPIFNR